jgi:hypothetical protein
MAKIREIYRSSHSFKMLFQGFLDPLIWITLPFSPNVFSYKQYAGLFGLEHQQQIEPGFDSVGAELKNPFQEVETKVEYVPATFHCVSGCGGNNVDPDEDINIYENGICVSQDTCLYVHLFHSQIIFNPTQIN